MKTLSDNTLRGLNKNALIKTIKELYAIRDKAIEYIEEHSIDTYEREWSMFEKCIPKDIIDILQGNKEEE